MPRVRPVPGGPHGGAAHLEGPGGRAHRPAVLEEGPHGPQLLRQQRRGSAPPDRGMYFILRLTQLIVRLDSRLGVLRYKIAPKCLLPGPFGHSGVGGNPGVERTVRSYNLVFTYPCQMAKGEEQEDGLSQGREAQDAGISCCPTLGGVLIIFPYLSYSYITVST